MIELASPTYLSGYLSRQLPEVRPDVEGVEVTEVSRLSRGVSRETWQVTARVTNDGGVADEVFMLRRDPPSGSVIPVGLREEYEVYRRLAGTAVPAASVLWFDDDPQTQPDGRPLYVRTHVAGTWRLPALQDISPERDAERVALSKEHIGNLATVHSVDWRAAGFADLYPVPDGPADCATTMLDFLLSRIAKFKFEPAPVVVAAVRKLRQEAPRDSPVIALCKGTNGLGEEVWQGGRIVAMSDWELCGLGDPAYDFAQLQDMIPEIVRDGRQVWGWAPALDYYAELTGWSVTKPRLDYYRRLHGLIMYMFGHHTAHLVCHQGARACVPCGRPPRCST